jgi:glyceraldehyde 3-phosphate dehydrogenase
MSYRVGINGFGRIGRSFVRCVVERGLLDHGLELVAVNDLWDVPTLAHLLANDSVFGGMRASVGTDGDAIVVDGHTIPVSRQRDAARLDWGRYHTDLVIESTGTLRKRDAAAAHLKAGARRVLISAPGKGADATLVPGVNADWFDPVRHEVVSAASCTTNCVAPMVAVLHEAFGVEQGFLTTAAPIVSRDIIGDPASCIVDGALTQASGAFAKVFGWYDNEWGYTNRLVDLTLQFAERS